MGSARKIVIQLPVFFTFLVCWYSAFPAVFTPVVELIPIRHYNESITDSVVFPETVPLAFKLGRVLGEGGEKVLENAREVLKAPRLSKARLDEIVADLLIEEDNGRIARLYGVLTFVNVLWLFAILGICVSVGPFLTLWCGPTIVRLLKTIARETLEILRLLYEMTYNFHDSMSAGLCFLIVLSSEKYREVPAVFVAFTGVALSIVSFVFLLERSGELDLFRPIGRRRYQNPQRHEGLQQFDLELAIASWSVAYTALALKMKSELFAFSGLGGIYRLLGLSVYTEPLVIFIGFDSEATLARCTIASAILVVTMITLRLFRINPEFLIPFRRALATFGSIGYFLGLLILQHVRGTIIISPAVVMVFSLVTGTFFGAFLNIPSLFNTSVVFACLYSMDRIALMNFWRTLPGFWAGVFASSIFVYQLSLWMHTNPDWMMKIFMMSE
jgi:hypothetical protein